MASPPEPADLRISPTTGVDDTDPEVRQRVIEALRRMTPAEKLQRVVDLNRTVETMALARIRKWYGPNLSERETRLRLAALRLSRETLIEVFDWDPDAHGR